MMWDDVVVEDFFEMDDMCIHSSVDTGTCVRTVSWAKIIWSDRSLLYVSLIEYVSFYISCRIYKTAIADERGLSAEPTPY